MSTCGSCGSHGESSKGQAASPDRSTTVGIHDPHKRAKRDAVGCVVGARTLAGGYEQTRPAEQA